MTNIIERPPCIQCKHLIYDAHKYAKLRLLRKFETNIDAKCTKNILRSAEHDIEFLSEPVTLHTDEEIFAKHVETCPHFTPITLY